jgi:predicted ATPase/DNA-binding CsgD family transcriptional regulator
VSRELDVEFDPEIRRIYLDVLRSSLPTIGPMPLVHRHNLPLPVTAFVGREREIGEVTRLLRQSRLLTLVGAGGCGKTRLALQVAGRLVADEASGEYPDGVWLIDLAALVEPELVPEVIVSVLGLHRQPDRPLTAALASALEDKRLLLILDNCEHLLDACASLANVFLLGCPHLHILATSRQALGIAGEWVWRVPSLELPNSNRPLRVDQIAHSEAVRLFLDRAQVSRLDFALTERNAGTVAEICRRLDGIPLALELAAARLQMLSVDRIAALLDDRFRLLTGGSRTALPRQQTLRATVDWSYHLLGVDVAFGAGQVLFDRLSVFAGGWTLEAVEAICAGPDVAADQILDRMAGLVDRSLVSAEAGADGAMRYHFLETLRQYAQERLSGRGEMAEIQRRHASYYLALTERAEPGLTGPQQVAWLDQLEKEHDNLRAAVKGSLENGQIGTAAQLCGALGGFWYARGHLREGIGWLDATLPGSSTLPARVRAKALMWAGVLRLGVGRSVPVDDAQGQSELEESLGMWRALGDRYWTAVVLNMLGAHLRERGGWERATDLLETGLAAAREIGDGSLIGLSLINLGDLARYRGDDERAASMYQESLALFRKAGDLRRIAFSLIGLAHIANRRGDLEQALVSYREGLAYARNVGDRQHIAVCLEGLADVARAQGQPVRAARLLGAAETLRDVLGISPSLAQRDVYGYLVEALDGSSGEPGYTTARAEGRAMAPEEAIGYAQAEPLPGLSTAGQVGEPPFGGQASPLTSRETTVAALVARGMTNRAIAEALSIVEGTAANHVHHTLGKLGLSSRGEIASWAIARGLLHDPQDSGDPFA